MSDGLLPYARGEYHQAWHRIPGTVLAERFAPELEGWGQRAVCGFLPNDGRWHELTDMPPGKQREGDQRACRRCFA